MADLRAKALGYLRDAHVRVLHARTRRLEDAPCEVIAAVQGHQGRYVVEILEAGTWSCTCPGFLHGVSRPCAHIAAVQLATGHPSAAAKPEKSGKAA